MFEAWIPTTKGNSSSIQTKGVQVSPNVQGLVLRSRVYVFNLQACKAVACRRVFSPRCVVFNKSLSAALKVVLKHIRRERATLYLQQTTQNVAHPGKPQRQDLGNNYRRSSYLKAMERPCSRRDRSRGTECRSVLWHDAKLRALLRYATAPDLLALARIRAHTLHNVKVSLVLEPCQKTYHYTGDVVRALLP